MDKFLYSQYESMLAIANKTALLLKNAVIENWPEEELNSLLQQREELMLKIDSYKEVLHHSQMVQDVTGKKLIWAIQAQDHENQQKLQAIKAETATRIGSVRRNNQAIKAYNSMPYDNDAYFMDKKS